jgi:uncharacterized membrane protein
MIKYEVINLLGETLAVFDTEEQAHIFADYQKNYCYVEQFDNGGE